MTYRTVEKNATSSSFYSIDDEDAYDADSALFHSQTPQPPKKIRKPLLQQLHRYGLRRREPSSPFCHNNNNNNSSSSNNNSSTNNTNSFNAPLTRRRSRLRHCHSNNRRVKNSKHHHQRSSPPPALPTRKSHRLERRSERPSYQEIPPSSDSETVEDVHIFEDELDYTTDMKSKTTTKKSKTPPPEIEEREVLLAGMKEKIEELREMVLFPLIYPEILSKLSINVPRGVLFHGPPGTGKTLLARYMAQSCRIDKKVSFYYRNGSDLLSKWMGEGERKLRDLFEEAKLNEPSIIFFDEIDGLAPSRSKMDSSSTTDQAHVSLVATLLALMDGLEDRGKVVVIGATNRIHSLDAALRRPGRFDREFFFPLPSSLERDGIIRLLCSKFSFVEGEDIDGVVEYLLMRTVAFSGADLSALCSGAALNGLRRFLNSCDAGGGNGAYVSAEISEASIKVCLADFEEALRKQIPSLERCPPSYKESLMIKCSNDSNINGGDFSVKKDANSPLLGLFEGVLNHAFSLIRDNYIGEVGCLDGIFFMEQKLFMNIGLALGQEQFVKPTTNQINFFISILLNHLRQHAFATCIDTALLDRMEMMGEAKMEFEYLWSFMGENYDFKDHYIIIPRSSGYLESSVVFRQFLREIGGKGQKCLLFINCESLGNFEQIVDGSEDSREYSSTTGNRSHFLEIDQISFGTWVREMVLRGCSSSSKEEQDSLIHSLIRDKRKGMHYILKKIMMLFRNP